jgi:hypothetical protein
MNFAPPRDFLEFRREYGIKKLRIFALSGQYFLSFWQRGERRDASGFPPACCIAPRIAYQVRGGGMIAADFAPEIGRI